MQQPSLHKQGYGPDLNKYVGKKLLIQLNGRRKISGIVGGHDKYMNIVLEGCMEHAGKDQNLFLGTAIVRGNSIIMWECLDKVL